MSDAIEGELVTRAVGRPTVVSMSVVEKLEAAFNNGYNITEACQYAEIDRKTFYNWLERDDIFSTRMSVAQAAPNKKAKEIVIKAIQNDDAGLAFRWLERRDPDFKPKAEVSNKLELTETREKIKEFLDDKSDLDDGSSQSAPTDSTEVRGEVAEAPADIS